MAAGENSKIILRFTVIKMTFGRGGKPARKKRAKDGNMKKSVARSQRTSLFAKDAAAADDDDDDDDDDEEEDVEEMVVDYGDGGGERVDEYGLWRWRRRRRWRRREGG